jgi:hypothetical protein
LDQLGTDFVASKFALVTTGDGQPQWKRGGQVHVQEVSPEQPEQQDGWRVVQGAVSRSFGLYVLNISKITQTVDRLAERFVKGSVGIYRSAEKAPAKEEPDLLRPKRKFKLEE